MAYKFKVVGLRLEKYLKVYDNDEENDVRVNAERHVLLLKDVRTRDKYELRLWDEDGMCYSGYCSASWAHTSLERVDEYHGMTHTVTEDAIFEYEEGAEEIQNAVFKLSEDGGDNWYPAGSYAVNMSMFKETIRSMPNRPVWVFMGDSGLGKSYIASYLSANSVYETDSDNQFPEHIDADVVVVGNRNHFTLADIKERVGADVNMIIVEFKKEN